MSNQYHLRQHIFERFMSKPGITLNFNYLSHLIHEEGYTVQDIFHARYDQSYLENIVDQEIFNRTVFDLETITATSKGKKIKPKIRYALLFNDDTFLLIFLNLLFTDKEKNVIDRMIEKVYDSGLSMTKKEEDKENESSGIGIQTLGFILKNIFRIGDQPSQSNQEIFQF